MNISKIFQLTEEDKAHYLRLIDKIDLNKSSEIIQSLNLKLDNLVSSKKLNTIETDLIKKRLKKALPQSRFTNVKRKKYSAHK